MTMKKMQTDGSLASHGGRCFAFLVKVKGRRNGRCWSLFRSLDLSLWGVCTTVGFLQRPMKATAPTGWPQALPHSPPGCLPGRAFL